MNGLKYLDKIYPDFYLDPSVTKHTESKSGKYDKIKEYLEYLKKLHIRNNLKILKYFYDKKYIIQKENIPKEYIQNLKMKYQQAGLEIHETFEQEIIQNIINDQKYSLHLWIDYITENINNYPTWFLYWVFQGVVRTGSFNQETKKYAKRTSKTIVPFLECYPICIKKLYNHIEKVIINKQTIEDKTFEQLIKNGNFEKVYHYIWEQQKLQENNQTQGVWLKYSKNMKTTPLVSSLEKQGTQWCTAISPNTIAKEHLIKGDFYVYYTYDENKLAKYPRIAIRTENDIVAEIRGIRTNQNIELNLLEILTQKLKELTIKEEHKITLKHLQTLKNIIKKIETNTPLTSFEQNFIETTEKIKYFGFHEDPIIEKIKTYKKTQ